MSSREQRFCSQSFIQIWYKCVGPSRLWPEARRYCTDLHQLFLLSPPMFLDSETSAVGKRKELSCVIRENPLLILRALMADAGDQAKTEASPGLKHWLKKCCVFFLSVQKGGGRGGTRETEGLWLWNQLIYSNSKSWCQMLSERNISSLRDAQIWRRDNNQI